MDDPFAITGAETCELRNTSESGQSPNYELVWTSTDGAELKTFPENVPDNDNWIAVTEWVEEALAEHGYTTVAVKESDSSVTWRLLLRV